MRFKIDENLPPDLAENLRAIGHDAMTVADQGLVGKIDPIIAEICKDEQRAIVTLDLDFANIRVYPPDEYSGIIVLRTSQPSRNRVVSMFQRAIDSFDVSPLIGSIWIVEDSRIRMRTPKTKDESDDAE